MGRWSSTRRFAVALLPGFLMMVALGGSASADAHLLGNPTGSDVDAADPVGLARFYERLLGWTMVACEGPRPGHPPQDGWAKLRSPEEDMKIEFQWEEHYVPPTWPPIPGQQQMMMHLDIEVDDLVPDVRIPVDAAGLAELAGRVIARAKATPDLDHLDLELPSVSDAIAELRNRLELDVETDFARLTGHLERPLDVVAYFLALLELARWGLVEARQETLGEPIVVRSTGSSNGPLVSEWDREDIT